MGFSVLMSVYYKEKPEYLKAAVESVMFQTLLPDEVVLVEDGPLTDQLYQVIETLKDRYGIIRTVILKENVQLGRALAEGVLNCRHELIARMDTDDICVSNRFEIQYQYMRKNPEITVVGGFIEEFNNLNIKKVIKKMPIEEEKIYKYMCYRNPLNHMTVMFRKDAVVNAGNYQHFPFLEDYYLWNRMRARGDRFANIPQVLVKARTSESLYERRGGAKYGLEYLKLRRIQRKLGITNIGQFLLGSLLSIAISFQPAKLRKMIYAGVLRR